MSGYWRSCGAVESQRRGSQALSRWFLHELNISALYTASIFRLSYDFITEGAKTTGLTNAGVRIMLSLKVLHVTIYMY